MITVTKYDAEVNRTATASRCQQLKTGIKVTRMRQVARKSYVNKIQDDARDIP